MTNPNKDSIIAALLAYRNSYGGVIPDFVLDTMKNQWGVAPRTMRWWIAEADKKATMTAEQASPH